MSTQFWHLRAADIRDLISFHYNLETEAPDSSTDPPPSTQEPHEALKEDEAESSTAAGIFDDLISSEKLLFGHCHDVVRYISSRVSRRRAFFLPGASYEFVFTFSIL